MSYGRREQFAVPVLVLLIGIGWLLNQAEILRGVDWFWTGFLAVFGIALLLLGKWSRGSVTGGVFMMILAVASIFRQSGRLTLEWEVPILVVILGVLMILAQLLPLPDSAKLPPDENNGKIDGK